MKRILAHDLIHYENETVLLKGWFHSFRSHGKLGFLIIRDGSGLAQIVVKNPEMSKMLSSIFPGSILKVIGTTIKSEEAALGVEIHNAKIDIEVPINTPPPIEYYKPEIPSDLEHILDHRSLTLRNRRIQAVFKIQAELVHAFRIFMHDQVKATEYFGPNITGTSSEGGAEFFTLDYFGYSATLAQSSQLYKQIMVGANERVFALMPFFRAEPSHTPRHLAEGKQFEFEMGFFDDWHEILDVQEDCIKTMIDHVNKHCQKELSVLEKELVLCPKDVPIPRITFKKAQEIYFEKTGIDERHEPDLSPAAERELCKFSRQQYGTDFIIITDWKSEKRPFYSFPNPKDPTLTYTFDLLCAGTEITSGGQRCHTYESVVTGIKEKGMDPANFQDYLTIFKYGMPPHGGFGMGLERLTMTILGIKNIREASLFPSDPKRIAANRIKANIVFGGENIRNEIIRLLNSRDIPFHHLKYDETPASFEKAFQKLKLASRGEIKTLILRGKKTKKNYQVNIPANLKVDMKAVAIETGEKCEFEDPEVIKERYGLIIGSVPPFGPLMNLETFIDENIFKNPKLIFNCGFKTESIVISSQDLFDVVDARKGIFSK